MIRSDAVIDTASRSDSSTRGLPCRAMPTSHAFRATTPPNLVPTCLSQALPTGATTHATTWLPRFDFSFRAVPCPLDLSSPVRTCRSRPSPRRSTNPVPPRHAKATRLDMPSPTRPPRRAQSRLHQPSPMRHSWPCATQFRQANPSLVVPAPALPTIRVMPCRPAPAPADYPGQTHACRVMPLRLPESWATPGDKSRPAMSSRSRQAKPCRLPHSGPVAPTIRALPSRFLSRPTDLPEQALTCLRASILTANTDKPHRCRPCRTDSPSLRLPEPALPTCQVVPVQSDKPCLSRPCQPNPPRGGHVDR